MCLTCGFHSMRQGPISPKGESIRKAFLTGRVGEEMNLPPRVWKGEDKVNFSKIRGVGFNFFKTMEELVDRFNRRIDYLRISVTDRCNLRCIYCMPECGIINKPQEELLSFEEIAEIVKASVQLGIDKIRLTGGEPLVRKNIVSLVKSLSSIDGIKDISMTTNGVLLKEYAPELKKAGLKRLNVSLDSLRQDRYKFITRQGNLEDVLEGIRESLGVGFSPVKINVLLLDGINKDEIADFLRLSIENPIHVRFLEFMPVCNSDFFKVDKPLLGKEVMDAAKKFSAVEEADNYGGGPARAYKFKNSLATFGIISPISEKFCASCNRLRLTSDGFLKACLHSDLKVNLRNPLRKGIDREALVNLIKSAVKIKPWEHSLGKDGPQGKEEFSMCQIGG